ncbi:MAG: helix-turn-helix transcriptional regulator [Candidatus Omnitrophica bacterium]|nr:helix-turn-helix transcriptional regulator [Candidatus Omnitrophota bacterium]
MLAVVKTPRTNRKILEIKGDISSRLIKYLHKEYGKNIIIKDDDDYIDIATTEWYKKRNQEMTPGLALKTYRQRDKLTQKQLGQKLGKISCKRISDFENNRRSISKEMAKKFASFFGTSVERFL